MTSRLRQIGFLTTGFVALTWVAQGAETGAASLLPQDSAARFRLSGGATEFAKMTTAPVSGQPFSTALRIEVGKKPESAARAEVAASVDADMKSGEVLMASFWVRAVRAPNPPGEAMLDTGFHPGFSRYSLPLSMPVNAGAAWKKVQFPFALPRDYAKGEAELFFTLGAQEQAVEIGGIELLNYGTSKRVADLPLTRLGYTGSEPNAAWRKAANQRIENIRKANLTVVVKDQAGKPVRNAAVAVRMRKHAFQFGTAVSGPVLSGRFGRRLSAEDVRKYKEQILQLFNFAVMENDLKWPQWSVVESRPATLAAVDWLRQNGIAVRGHNLVWPSWRNTPVKAAEDAKGDRAALAKVILDHIGQTTTALKGRLADWDVINETFSNHEFMDILGRHAMVDWFKAARAGDPTVKLFINDFNILAGDDQAHRDDYAATIQYLIEQGAPLDGIGLQSHFPARVTPPEEVLKRLDRFAAFKRDLKVTEFDIDTNDELTQADYTRDFMTAVFSHPSVPRGVTPLAVSWETTRSKCRLRDAPRHYASACPRKAPPRSACSTSSEVSPNARDL
jgi:endo-1,4-beta-xylanase